MSMKNNFKSPDKKLGEVRKSRQERIKSLRKQALEEVQFMMRVLHGNNDDIDVMINDYWKEAAVLE